MHTDYAAFGVLSVLLFFILRKFPVLACTLVYIVLVIMDSSEAWSLLAFIALLLYNGKRGRQNKYFFYAFYPAHLFVLGIMKYLL